MATSAIVEREFDRNLRPRERHRGFPRLALRERSAEHPMIMFFLVAAAAFTAMAVVPPTGAAFATIDGSAAGSARVEIRPEANAPRKAGLSETEIVCHGQVWGAESTQCLDAIAKESGRADGHKVRVIAGA